MANIISADERRPFRDADPSEIAVQDVDFICDTMKIDPRKRPTADALLRHEWFESED